MLDALIHPHAAELHSKLADFPVTIAYLNNEADLGFLIPTKWLLVGWFVVIRRTQQFFQLYDGGLHIVKSGPDNPVIDIMSIDPRNWDR